MKLKLNGKPLDLSPKLTAGSEAIKSFLDKSPEEIFTQDEVSKRVDVGATTIRRFIDEPKLSIYVHKSKARYFGHPEAIKELKRLLAEQSR